MFGCNSPSSPLEKSNIEPVEMPFPFHKPNLGATFTMQALRNGSIDTTFHFTIADTSANFAGKSGVVEFAGYYRPFYISYRPSGDIDMWESGDYIYGRNNWMWFPLAVLDGQRAQTYSHDSLISNPNPNDTKQLLRDTVTVVGKEILMINGKPIECIRIVLTATITLQSLTLPFPFSVTSSLKIDYWYAPSIGYWAKEHIKYGADDITFTLIDYTL